MSEERSNQCNVFVINEIDSEKYAFHPNNEFITLFKNDYANYKSEVTMQEGVKEVLELVGETSVVACTTLAFCKGI